MAKFPHNSHPREPSGHGLALAVRAAPAGASARNVEQVMGMLNLEFEFRLPKIFFSAKSTQILWIIVN